MTQQEILQHKVEGRVLTYLHRIKVAYERTIYNTIGRGVTPQEYTEIIDRLVEKGAIKRTTGDRDAVILHWIE